MDRIWNRSNYIPVDSRGSQEPNQDRSQTDLRPLVASSTYRAPHSVHSDPDQSRYMVTVFQEEISYCCPGTSSGKQKKARSTSQPQLGSENFPAKIEADQILLAPQ